MANKSTSARDQQIADAGSSTLSMASGFSRDQVISVTDLISEGEIEGLVYGESSIYLNDERIKDLEESSISESNPLIEGAQVTLTNNSTTVTVNKELGSLFQNVFFRSFSIKNVYSSIVTVGTISASSLDLDVPTIPISTSVSFFDAATMAVSGYGNIIRLTISETLDFVEGFITVESGTQATFHSSITDGVSLRRFLEASAGKTLTCTVDGWLFIPGDSVIDGTGTSTITLITVNPYPSGSYNFSMSSPSVFTGIGNTFNATKFQGATTEFRTGKREQLPMTNYGGVSASTTVASLGLPLTFSDAKSDSPSNDPLAPKTITSSSSLNLTSAQAREVDELRLVFSYGSLICQSEEDGKKYDAGAMYKIEAKIYRSSTEYSTVTLVNRRIHTGKSQTAIVFEERINLEPFKPFSAFDIIVTRLTRESGVGIDTSGNDKDDRDRISAPCTLTTVTSVIKENLSYPFTAYANVTFSSKDFSSPPKRSYHAKGLKVLVPSNYITRDMNDGLNSIYDGLWDGSFRPQKVYTNNPAWVFYDIITNNRYGLGDWIKAEDIDKFALYRIAKYCDVLVSDGKGGQEPRFTSNIYLTKATDAYKVLKDMASSFLTMIYWIDGQVLSVIDQAKDPIYTFSKANVTDGAFSYETTGSKTRANQIIVTWNNPESNYKLEPLIVEDKYNIAETGRIISENAVAFGCTSEAQAYRYGKWKLWTAINQTRLVSFSTSINAVFLTPGDIIKIQDADEFNIAYSGRISNSGTLDLNTIPLDREVTLVAGSTYYLSTIIEAPNVTNEGEAEQHDTIVETIQVISTGITSSLELVSNLTALPQRSAVWVLKEVTAEGASSASAKDYKILGVNESSKNEFSLVAVEHYDEKFDAIEGDFTLVTPDTVFPKLLADDIIPAPKNVYIESAPDYNKAGDEFALTWDLPVSEDGSLYLDLSGYEILHNVPGYDNKISVSSNINKYIFEAVPNGTYSVGVRTINTIDNRSKYTTQTFSTTNLYTLNVPRQAEGVGVGGTADSGLRLNANYVLSFEVDPVSFYAVVNPFSTFSGSITGVDTISSNLVDGKYSVLFDRSEAALIAVSYNTTASHGVTYWYNAIEASGAPENTFSIKTGTVSIAINSSKVVGAGTAFLTDYSIGQLIRFNSAQAARIVTIIDDTNLVLDRSFSSAVSASTHYSPNLVVDFLNDVIVAEFTKNGSVSSVKSLTGVDTTLTGPQGARGFDSVTVSLTSDDYSIVYDENGLNPVPTSVTLTATAQNVENAFFKFNINGVQEPGFTDGTTALSDTRSVTIPVNYFDAPINILVAVSDGDQVELAFDTISLFAVKPGISGIDGTDAITAVMSNEAHVLSTTSSGVVDYAGSGTIIELYEGATALNYDGIGTAPGTWKFTHTSINISISDTITDSGTYVTIGNHKDMIAVNGSISYIITGKRLDGVTDVSLTKTQSFSKSIEGYSPVFGVDYFNGVDGVDGDPGETGPRTATGFVYYQFSSASPPTTPTATSYSFSAGAFTGLSGNWLTSAPVFQAGNANKYWYSSYTVAETVFEGAQTLQFSISLQGIGFSGLVTFTGDNLTDGTTAYDPAVVVNAGVTTINGGKITADSIDAAQLKISSGTSSPSSMFFDGTNNRIDIKDSGGFLRVRIGNLIP